MIRKQVIYANCGKSRKNFTDCDRPFRSCCFFSTEDRYFCGYCYVRFYGTDAKTGGIVFTDTKRTEPSVGDIVTFRNAQGKISHRVVAKQKQSYITKGDANNTEDVSLLESEQIIGTVILTVPLLGYAAELLKDKTVGMLLLLMIFQELVFLVIEWKGERIEKRRRKQI